MGKFVDILGKKSHSLTAVAFLGKPIGKRVNLWKCFCDCGGETIVNTGDFNSGRVKSCGCYSKRKGKDSPAYRHGLTKTAEYQHDKSIKRRYKITLEEYELLCDMQNNLCAICNKPEDNKRVKRLAVDHCHATKRIRGLLCTKCNRAIGMLKDDTSILKSAIDYLKRNEVM